MHYDSEHRWDIFKGICKHCVAYQMFYVRKKRIASRNTTAFWCFLQIKTNGKG